MDNYDRCYECRSYGNDWFLNEENEWESTCDDCPYHEIEEYDG